MPGSYRKIDALLIEQMRTAPFVECALGRDPGREQLFDAEASLDALAHGLTAGEQIDRRSIGHELVALGAPPEAIGLRPELPQDGDAGAIRLEGRPVHH